MQTIKEPKLQLISDNNPGSLKSFLSIELSATAFSANTHCIGMAEIHGEYSCSLSLADRRLLASAATVKLEIPAPAFFMQVRSGQTRRPRRFEDRRYPPCCGLAILPLTSRAALSGQDAC